MTCKSYTLIISHIPTFPSKFKCKKFLFLPLLCSLLFLIACDPDDEPKKFSATVQNIGLREFIISVNSGPVSGQLTFIASEDSAALPWLNVPNNPARLVRKFASEQKREIYFSLTDAYNSTETTNELVDLATNPISTTKTAVPGIMIPGQNYYVHAYKSDGSNLVTLGPITTKNYPATMPSPIVTASTAWPDDPYYTVDSKPSLGAYYWGMYFREGPSGDVRPIEVKRGEAAYIPARLFYPAEDNNRALSLITARGAFCAVTPVSMDVRRATPNQRFSSPVISFRSNSASASFSNGIVFTNSTASTYQNYVRDIMYWAGPTGPSTHLDVTLTATWCEGPIGFPVLATVKVVEE